MHSGLPTRFTTKIGVVGIAALVVTAIAQPAAGAGSRVWDCFVQMATLQVPAAQAQGHLPKGYEIGQGPAGQKHVTNLAVESWACGDNPIFPTASAAFAYVAVEPPEKHGSDDYQRFVLAAASFGPEQDRLAKNLCAPSLFDDGHITAHNAQDYLGGLSRGSTTASSPNLSFTMKVTASGGQAEIVDQHRWFYRDGRTVRFFDYGRVTQFLGTGAATVSFDEPFLDLPPIHSGIAFYDRIWLTIPGSCATEATP